jgi:hypothetical protein
MDCIGADPCWCWVQKDKRLTTSKGKVGFRFYDMVDTKNRNRERRKPKAPRTERIKERKSKRQGGDSD